LAALRMGKRFSHCGVVRTHTSFLPGTEMKNDV
jgi:hypothetical protein